MKNFIEEKIYHLASMVSMLKDSMETTDPSTLANIEAMINEATALIESYTEMLTEDIVHFDNMSNEPIFIVKTYKTVFYGAGSTNEMIEERAFADKHTAMNYHERMKAVCTRSNIEEEKIGGISSRYYSDLHEISLYK